MRLNRTGIFVSLLLAAFALSLASCGGGGSTTPNTTGKAMVRFINGSPDAGAVDVLVNGTIVASDVAYGQITAYQSLTVGTNPLPQVAFVKTGTHTNIFPAANGSGPNGETFQLGAAVNSKVTVVVEGRAALIGSLGLQVGAFIEPTITVTGTNYAVVYHHASPAANAAAPSGLNIGQITLGPQPVYLVQGSMLFSSTQGSATSLVGVSNQPAFIGPPGVGFYVGPSVVVTATPVPITSSTASPSPTPTVTATPIASPTVYAGLVPGPAVTGINQPAGDTYPINGVDPNDTSQSMPDGTNNTLFTYVIDANSPTGCEMIGTFTN
jgi:hypothetical protein